MPKQLLNADCPVKTEVWRAAGHFILISAVDENTCTFHYVLRQLTHQQMDGRCYTYTAISLHQS